MYKRQLEDLAQPIQANISQSKEELKIKYETSVQDDNLSQKESIYQNLLDMYDQNQDKEFRRQTTVVGPHRDDLAFYVNGHNVQTYGSQGQQRTTSLSVKLAEIDLMKEKTSEYPVLLLDDVLSELDDNRQTHLLKTIENKVQVFLTTTSLEGVKIELLNQPEIYFVSSGQVTVDSDRGQSE